MACNKKSLLLLLAIPCHCVGHILLNRYLDYRLSNSEIVCFAAFIICACVILATHNTIARAVCLALSNLCIVALFFLKNSFFSLTAQELLIYCIFELPSIILLIMMTAPKKESSSQVPTEADEYAPQPEKRGIKRFLNYHSFYKAFLSVLTIILLVCILTGKEPVNFQNPANFPTFWFGTLFFVLLFAWLVLRSKQEFVDSELRDFFGKLMQTSALYFLIDQFWAKQYSQNTVYLCVPIYICAIVVVKHFNVIAMIKKTIIKKKQ